MGIARTLVAIGVIGTALLGARTADAAPIYNSNGFEFPPFVAGLPLEGQDPANGPWLTTATTSTSLVQTTVVESGTQAVRINRAGGDDARWGVVKPLDNVAGTITIAWDQHTLQTVLPAGSFGPFFGVEAYDDLPSGSVQRLGAAGIDAATGELLYLDPNVGFAVTGDVVAFGTWHQLAITLDYGTQAYSVFLDGVLKVTVGFENPGADDFTDAPLTTVAAAGDPASLSANGTAFFDNYVITTPALTQVPEPATLSLLGIAAVALAARRLRRRR